MCIPLDHLALEEDPEYPDLTEHNNEVDKRGKWQMRMFKRDMEEEEHDGMEDNLMDEAAMDMNKRGQPWKMRMFKKQDPWQMRMFKRSQPWKMRMFKRYPAFYTSEFDKKSPWKMRMFKRYYSSSSDGFGKRPDKWQMRMFKRDPALSQPHHNEEYDY